MVPAQEIHHIVHKALARLGTPLRWLIDSDMNCISLCHSCHQGANATEKKREHLELLRREDGYEYRVMPWRGMIG